MPALITPIHVIVRMKSEALAAITMTRTMSIETKVIQCKNKNNDK